MKVQNSNAELIAAAADVTAGRGTHERRLNGRWPVGVRENHTLGRSRLDAAVGVSGTGWLHGGSRCPQALGSRRAVLQHSGEHITAPIATEVVIKMSEQLARESGETRGSPPP